MIEKTTTGSTYQLITKGTFSLVSNGYTLLNGDAGVFYITAIADEITITTTSPYNLQLIK